MDRIYLAALQMVPGIGNARLKALSAFFGSARQIWQADRRDLFFCGCLEEELCNNLLLTREKIDIPCLAEEWQKNGIQICTLQDPDYPSLLRDTFNPPLLLFYKGTLPRTEKKIAMVGARKASAYGKNVTNMLAADLAAAGICIISGAARGIDSAAHKGAMRTGSTLAVLGCGVNVVYPPENRRLLAEIAANGAVISEYLPDTPAHPGRFPARNRIISGLAKGVVVVEAAAKSGSLITADFALEEGRDVFAVPGSVFSSTSRGTHRLIKQGAKLIDCAADILEEYNWQQQPLPEVEMKLNEEETMVYSLLSYEKPVELDEIVAKSYLSAPVITYILLQLQLRGLVAECEGRQFIRTAKTN
ncbi:dna recombination-mediator protein a [Lucifera butyrica]|uniref:Dna recombination-mediator protein a n=1 Tax=Lucifera butyrica TaxID=1351585 RepID=A0A498RAX2_9FIRM|nr:DNA-processing protein DprA [Lucifera butyrica]VBB08110.1 dna recombination-mediator protein a [Lucifera butyrica]